MTPTIGRIIHVLIDPTVNNGAEVAPAIITRVWGGDNGASGWSINYRIIRDNYPDSQEWKTSGALYADLDAALHHIKVKADLMAAPTGQTPEVLAAQMRKSGTHAFWPPRES